jgi:hypothetical protein
MSKISRYQEGIIKFLKTKSFINDTTETTKNILLELIESSDHVPAILCLTVLNNQCKKYDLKIHGYYLATGIDALMVVARVSCNRDYYDEKYGQNVMDNMIMEVTSSFYKCITQNIETLRLSKNNDISIKLTQLCIEYSARMIPLITKKNTYDSKMKMKKTDILAMGFDNNTYSLYKKKNKLEKTFLFEDTKDRYGSVCKMAMSLGWIIGQGDETAFNRLKTLSDEKTIAKLEGLGELMGKFLKIHDDFVFMERDIKTGRFSLNYVVNYGIKEAYSELVESRAEFTEGSIILGVGTRTSREIIDMVIKNIDEIVKDVSVDINTQYDDVSTI